MGTSCAFSARCRLALSASVTSMQVSMTSVVAFLLCAAAVVAVESDIVPEGEWELEALVQEQAAVSGIGYDAVRQAEMNYEKQREHKTRQIMRKVHRVKEVAAKAQHTRKLDQRAAGAPSQDEQDEDWMGKEEMQGARQEHRLAKKQVQRAKNAEDMETAAKFAPQALKVSTDGVLSVTSSIRHFIAESHLDDPSPIRVKDIPHVKHQHHSKYPDKSGYKFDDEMQTEKVMTAKANLAMAEVKKDKKILAKAKKAAAKKAAKKAKKAKKAAKKAKKAAKKVAKAKTKAGKKKAKKAAKKAKKAKKAAKKAKKKAKKAKKKAAKKKAKTKAKKAKKKKGIITVKSTLVIPGLSAADFKGRGASEYIKALRWSVAKIAGVLPKDVR